MHAARFYEHLYFCIGSIKSGGYSNFERWPDPTVGPSASPLLVPMVATWEPTLELTKKPSNVPIVEPTGGGVVEFG